ncbi:hypothetical protein ACFLYN_03240 [Chloroflexota bacterium]
MNVLKNLVVGILCFLLFLSLSIFGIAYTINSTLLNPDFISNEIDRIPVSSLVQEFVQIESPPEMPELEETVHATIEALEPVVKERINDTIHAVYARFPNEVEDIELNELLRENFLTSDFISSVLERIDIAEIARLFITEQFTEEIPLEIENFDEYIEDAIIAAEPAIKAQLDAASGPIFDYILGMRQTLNVSISLDEVTDSIKDSIRQSLLDNPPPELATVPRELRMELFDAFYDEIAEMIPTSFAIDNSVINSDIPDNVNEVLIQVKDGMEEAATYVSLFQTVYILLIAFMALLVIIIILILRDVRNITRRLGVPLITYGALQYVGIWVARLVSGGKINIPEVMPAFFEEWIYQLAENILKPVEIFSLVLLITGIVLVVVSYVYKRGEEPDAFYVS